MSIQTEWNALELTETVKAHRKADYPVHPLFLNRWSSRSFTDRPVSDEVLHTVLEAARWAPSSGNTQPWRFWVARTEEQLAKVQSFLRPSNKLWAGKAPVLLVVASSKLKPDGNPHGGHAFDAGAAWASLALQAKLLGLATRAIGGFDREAARAGLNVPDTFELHAVVALGYPGDLDALDASFHDKEVPNGRRPLADSLIGDEWK